jgi:hypothetical protein
VSSRVVGSLTPSTGQQDRVLTFSCLAKIGSSAACAFEKARSTVTTAPEMPSMRHISRVAPALRTMGIPTRRSLIARTVTVRSPATTAWLTCEVANVTQTLLPLAGDVTRFDVSTTR